MESRNKHGSRLLRRTFAIALLLVSGGLITSGLIELYFRYQESVESIGALQAEMARGAAFKIQQFVRDIEKTLRGAAQTREIVEKGLTDNYRFDLIKLLKNTPAITEVTVVGPTGREAIKMSRVRTILDKELQDRSTDKAFLGASAGPSFFGPVYFVRQSEPYMRIAVPIERFAGEVIGVLIADVNLKYIWDVVSQIKVGQSGYAYVVSREGDLIAHPDISLVLQKRNLKQLGQVTAALADTPGPLAAQPNLAGKQVFPAYAGISDLGWAVLVERPASEANAPLYASMFRTSLLLIVGLGLAVFASLLIGRRVLRPVQTLREGAARIGAGALDHRIDIHTGDELEELADEFNQMTSQLQDSYTHLEQRVDERTRELSEALEQQTATREILEVISSSPTDVQPVLDAVVANAARLCNADNSYLFRPEGETYHLVASHGASSPVHGMSITRESLVGRAILDQETIHVPDLSAALDEFPTARPNTEQFGTRTFLATPLLREGVTVGVLASRRTEVNPFSENQVALMKTFADQAVIAIENVRLFQELQTRTGELARSVEELEALSEVSQAVSSTLELETVLTRITSHAVRLTRTAGGAIYEYDETNDEFLLRATDQMGDELAEELRANPPQLGEGAVGQAGATRQPFQIPEVLEADAYKGPLRTLVRQSGFQAILAVPLLREDHIVGGIVVWRKVPGEFPSEVVDLLQTLATQSVLAIQNARLFNAIEAANRHKSQFLANVSHELRTPLNAIIGFTRMVIRKTGDQIPKLQADNLQKVLISSQHLLSLINDLLDLAKIEAGRMEVFTETFKLNDLVQATTSTVEPLLKTGRVQLLQEINPDFPPLNTDREKLRQMLLNLLSNSAKFTEEGEIKVSASQQNGSMSLVVSDTGIGMTEGALKSIFDEFRQADMSSTRKYGGTGLGLAIVKKFANLLGGDIGVESELGKGSTFTITLPINLERSEEKKGTGDSAH